MTTNRYTYMLDLMLSKENPNNSSLIGIAHQFVPFNNFDVFYAFFNEAHVSHGLDTFQSLIYIDKAIHLYHPFKSIPIRKWFALTKNRPREFREVFNSAYIFAKTAEESEDLDVK